MQMSGTALRWRRSRIAHKCCHETHMVDMSVVEENILTQSVPIMAASFIISIAALLGNP